jgi:hypothetical protein
VLLFGARVKCAFRRDQAARLQLIYFARINSAIRMSPAIAAKLEERLWDIGDIVKRIEADEAS